MTARFRDTILAHCKQLIPVPTDLEPKLAVLDGIRAVCFDVYGTMLISASGDIGSDSGSHQLKSLQETIAMFGLRLDCPPEVALQTLEKNIRDEHAQARADGVAYPEVDIVQMWRNTLAETVAQPLNCDLDRFALEFEVRVNPVWPMPGVREAISKLKNAGVVLGIVSNAQFFTPLLFPALLNESLTDLGFPSDLSYFSFEHGQAKPGVFLYQLAQRQLAAQGTEAHEVLYVGNDMLNDVTAASAVGFRTALFAGDRRSLRLRAGDERTGGVVPDIVLTALHQLPDCVTPRH